jgi:hypothetical protein
MKYVLERERREAEGKVIEAQGRSRAIETRSEARRANPISIRSLSVEELSDRTA